MPKSKHKKKSDAGSKPQASRVSWIGTGNKAAEPNPDDYDEHMVVDLGRTVGIPVPINQLRPAAATCG